jgi:lipopolysaccharide biosynthesis glycosyltransferase
LNEEIKPLKIYIGWDSREDIAYQVAKHSIEKNASVPVEILPIKQKDVRKNFLYWRPVDHLASTEFTFTRFLIPELNEFNGWALFIDCDFVAIDDVAKLFAQADDRYAVMCAQHDYTPSETTKMDGKVQHMYPRKNWSSMMLINCGHPSNAVLNKKLVNDINTTGAYLHRFSWLKDEEIGELSHEWNWLVGWYKEPKDGKPKFLHYTEGGPWFEQYQTCEYNHYWYEYKSLYLEQKLLDAHHKIEKLKNREPGIDDLSLTDQKKILVKKLFEHIVDPQGIFYKESKNFNNLVRSEMGNKVAAIDSVGGLSYANKGLEYDAYLTSFILGSGGIISAWDKEKDTSSTLVIRGLGGGSQKAIKHCWETGRTFYAIDTGYFGNDKKKNYHRVTKNALQNTGPIIDRPGDRLKKIGYTYVPFTSGSKILICPPSEKVMNLWGQPDPETWTKEVVEQLKKYTDRPIEIRLKPIRSERISTKTIQQALAEDVYCLITYNSIAATEALMNGKPAIALGPNAASVLCNNSLTQIEKLKIPTKDEMEAFVKHLSYCQFTQHELQNGYAWQILNESS